MTHSKIREIAEAQFKRTQKRLISKGPTFLKLNSKDTLFLSKDRSAEGTSPGKGGSRPRWRISPWRPCL